MKNTLNIIYCIIVLVVVAFLIRNTIIIKNETTKEPIELINCIDGDTANIKYNGNIQKIRLLAINTKEVGEKEEPYGEEASKYTCEKLKNASKIELEFDELSNKYDKYDRLLGWIFVDDKLLQLDLVEKGYAEVKYIYYNYKYLDELKQAEKEAKEKKLGLWQIYY